MSNSYLTPEDHVIFIDDVLANGKASKGVMDLCEKAGAKIEAMGFIIEKAFQHGGDFLRKEGIRYEALATVCLLYTSFPVLSDKGGWYGE